MVNSIKKAFILIKDMNPLFLLLLTFQMIINFTLIPVFVQSQNSPLFWVSLISNFFLYVAFASGWLVMTKKLAHLPQKPEDMLFDNRLFKEFFPAVGEYFLPTSLYSILSFALLILIVFLGYKIGVHFFGNFVWGIDALNQASSSFATYQKFIADLSPTQFLNFSKWIFYITSLFILFAFFNTFWLLEIFVRTKNVFFAFFKTIKFIFKNFFVSVGIFAFLFFLQFFMSFIMPFTTSNIVISVIFIFLYGYLICYSMVVLFLFYEEKINCNRGCDCDGKDCYISKNSQKTE